MTLKVDYQHGQYRKDRKNRVYKRYTIFELTWKLCGHCCTRHTGSQSNKCDGIDAVLQIDEAAEMTSDITNDGSAAADESN